MQKPVARQRSGGEGSGEALQGPVLKGALESLRPRPGPPSRTPRQHLRFLTPPTSAPTGRVPTGEAAEAREPECGQDSRGGHTFTPVPAPGLRTMAEAVQREKQAPWALKPGSRGHDRHRPRPALPAPRAGTGDVAVASGLSGRSETRGSRTQSRTRPTGAQVQPQRLHASLPCPGPRAPSTRRPQHPGSRRELEAVSPGGRAAFYRFPARTGARPPRLSPPGADAAAATSQGGDEQAASEAGTTAKALNGLAPGASSTGEGATR